MTTKLWGLILSTALTQVACSAGSAETTESEDVGLVAARIVYTVNLSATHKIDFYEYAFGVTGTHETFPVGEEEALRLPDDQPRTLAELFKLVQPDAAVPEAVELADERALVARQETEARLAVDPDFLGGLARFEARDSSAAVYEGAEELGKSSEAAITCSGDFFGDQWGAAWYIQNYGRGFSNGVTCPPTPPGSVSFSDQSAITNAFMSSARHASSRILQWKQMEGDFSNAGSTKGSLVAAGATSGVTMWQRSISPRFVSIDTLNPFGLFGMEWFVTGTSPCSHLHRTLVWCTGS